MKSSLKVKSSMKKMAVKPSLRRVTEDDHDNIMGGYFDVRTPSPSGAAGLVKSDYDPDIHRTLIRLFLKRASRLKKADAFSESDPYVKVTFPAPKSTLPSQHCSEVIQDNSNPVWEESLYMALLLANLMFYSYFLGNDHADVAKIEVFDWDSVNQHHDLLGTAFITKPQWEGKEMTVDLDTQGTITLSLDYLRLDTLEEFDNMKNARMKEIVISNLAIRDPIRYVYIMIQKAVQVPAADQSGLSDPYVVISFPQYKHNDRKYTTIPRRQRTSVCEKTLNPAWNQHFFFVLGGGINQVHLSLLDHDAVSGDDNIGEIEVDLMDMENQMFPWSTTGAVWLSIRQAPCRALF